MLETVQVIHENGFKRELSLRNYEGTGFIITSIDGLGPVKASVDIINYATMDGGIFSSSSIGDRNIVFEFTAEDTNDVEKIRLDSYRIFPVKKRIRLVFITDHRKVYIDGIVESNVPKIFQERVTMTVSVICPAPYFISDHKSNISYYAVDGGFEFPFSNESVSDPLLEFSTLHKNEVVSIPYGGDSESGIVFEMDFEGEATGLEITNLTTNTSMTISLDGSITGGSFLDPSSVKARKFQKGDYLVINTIAGERSITGSIPGLFDNLKMFSKWITLIPGMNSISYKVIGSDTEKHKASLYYRELYYGV